MNIINAVGPPNKFGYIDVTECSENTINCILLLGIGGHMALRKDWIVNIAYTKFSDEQLSKLYGLLPSCGISEEYGLEELREFVLYQCS